MTISRRLTTRIFDDADAGGCYAQLIHCETGNVLANGPLRTKRAQAHADAADFEAGRRVPGSSWDDKAFSATICEILDELHEKEDPK